MKTYKLENFTRGWIYGDFEPSIYRTKDTEVGLLSFKAGEKTKKHFHKKSIEINLIVSGQMVVNGEKFFPGDIFVFERYDISEVEFIEDTTIVVVKTPSIPDDKYYV